MSPTTFLKGSLNLDKITTITIPSASSTQLQELCYTAFEMGKSARKIQSKNISSLRKGVGISTWAMKKPGCCRGFVGYYTTQLSGDYNKPSHGWKTIIRMLQTIPIWCMEQFLVKSITSYTTWKGSMAQLPLVLVYHGPENKSPPDPSKAWLFWEPYPHQ